MTPRPRRLQRRARVAATPSQAVPQEADVQGFTDKALAGIFGLTLLATCGEAAALVEGSPNTGANQGLTEECQVYVEVRAEGETLRLCSSDDGLVDGEEDPEFARHGEEILLGRPSAALCQDDAGCRQDEVCRDWNLGLARAAMPEGVPFVGGCVVPISLEAAGHCDEESGPGDWVELVADETGSWRLDLAGERDQSTRNTRYWAVEVLQPGGTSTELGRVHSRYWVLDAHDFGANPTSANYYALVPTGAGGAFVFVIDFDGMMGYVYQLFANATGNVDNPSRSWCQYGDPRPDRSCVDRQDPDYDREVHRLHRNRSQYEIYLNYPDGVTEPEVEPLIGDLQFNDEHGTLSISPNGDGEQDTGTFSFTANVRGTYRIVVDTDGDGVFDPSRDVVLVGEAFAGANNEHEWDGRGPDGEALEPGSYSVQVSLVVGETHFPMLDIESNALGVAIWSAPGPNLELEALPMFWDDTAIGGSTSLPDGSLIPNAQGVGTHERHAWDDAWLPSLGNVMAIDTWVQGRIVAVRELSCRRCEGTQQVVVVTDAAGDEQPDSDGDGILDWDEDRNRNGVVDPGETDPNSADSDADGLDDGAELSYGTDPLLPDSDEDGLLDGAEDANGDGQRGLGETDALNADTDGDGISDGAELTGVNPTDPLRGDSDGDGLPDGLEDANHNGALDPGETNPAAADSDGDGLDDGVEDQDHDGILDPDETDPRQADTDGDGLDDPVELARQPPTDPTNPDSDEDGLPDGAEVSGGTDPLVADSDGDGVLDGAEDANGNGLLDVGETDPRSADSDGDGLPDGIEDADHDGRLDPGETDPRSADSDGDGLDDGAEDTNLNGTLDPGETDPRAADSDADGLPDGLEDADRDGRLDPDETDPRSADSDGDELPDGIEDADHDGAQGATETDPRRADSDADGLPDGLEDANRDGSRGEGETDPLAVDSDGDQLPDGLEDANRDGALGEGETDPRVADSDGDGLPDGVEDANQSGGVDEGETDPTVADSDGDGLPDGVEDLNGDGLVDEGETDPRVADSDGDGVLDGVEDANGNGQLDEGETDPLVADSDGDGLADGDEDLDGDGTIDPGESDPLSADGDDDGLDDSAERQHGTDPQAADSDGDGLPDGLEVNGARPTDPTSADTDGDDLGDGVEDLDLDGEQDPGETDPADGDSDDDGLLDGAEGLDDFDGDETPDALDADSDNDLVADGTELGLTADDVGPDTDPEAFVPDADPTTQTDPRSADTDGGGLADGAEDTNRNGALDPGERDPLDPADDELTGVGTVAASGCECAAGGGGEPEWGALLWVGLGLLLLRRRRHG